MAEKQMRAFSLQFEVVADEQEPARPALLGDVGRAVMQGLRKQGYSMEPVYTGEKGGEFFEFVKQVAVTAWENREIIAAVATDITAIVTMVGNALQKHKETQREEATARIKIVSSNGSSVEVEGSDAESLGKALDEVEKRSPGFMEQLANTDKPQITARIQQPSKRRRR